MTGTMTIDEAMALARLRQWCSDRQQLSAAHTVDYMRRGWQERNDRHFDARLVRVIDFSRAMQALDPREQAALILTHRDREPASAVARALGCCERTVCNILPEARRKLAAQLDRMNLL